MRQPSIVSRAKTRAVPRSPQVQRRPQQGGPKTRAPQSRNSRAHPRLCRSRMTLPGIPGRRCRHSGGGPLAR
eukprot:1796563-Lingulodinium_polyedra.AAC.1